VIINKWEGFDNEVEALGEISARFSGVLKENFTHVYARYNIRLNEIVGYYFGDFSESEKASIKVLSPFMHPFQNTLNQEIIVK